MLERLQQFTTLAALAVLIASVGAAAFYGSAAWAWAGAFAIMGVGAGVLAMEFILMARVNRRDPAPRATFRQIFSSWLGECGSAIDVFCWRQPFRSGRWPDLLVDSRSGLRGVVLVHGYLCNRGLWNRWLQKLHERRTPFIAINLEPLFGSIDEYVPIIDRAVSRLRDLTGIAPVIVAHSMGGLAARRWCAQGATAPHHVITIGTPHRGTWMARFAWTRNGRQMRPGSAWLTALAKSAETDSLAGCCTCFYGHCDNMVFPASTATLPGADNRHLAGVAHVRMVDRPEPFDELIRVLQR